MALEDIQSITQGAEVMATYMNQGLSQEAAEEKVVNDVRQAQRERYRQRQAREGNRAAAEAFLAENDAAYDFVGSPVDEDDLIRSLEIQAGENPQELFDESGLQDKSKRQDYEIKREKANRVSKNENSTRADKLQQRAYEAAERQKAFDFGLVPLGDNAVSDAEGTAVMGGRSGGPLDAYNAIQARVQSGEIGIDDPVPDGSGKTVRDVLRRIEETEFPAITRDRDVEQGRSAVAESRRRSEGALSFDEIEQESERRARQRLPEGTSMSREQGPVRRDDNPLGLVPDTQAVGDAYKAEVDLIKDDMYRKQYGAMEGEVDVIRSEVRDRARREADDIAASPLGQAARQGQRNIDRIAQIKAIGAVKDKNPQNMTREMMFDDSATYGTATRMVGPDGVTVGYADPRGEAFLGDINAGDTANMANAPQLPRGYDWVAQNVGGQRGRPGATSFGEPSAVDITGTLRDFASRVNGGGDNGVISDIRSMGEFEGAVDRVIQKAEQEGKGLFSYNTEAGKNTAATAPGVDEVLNKLHYSSPEKAQLAQALYQLSAAQESGVNQDYKDSYAARTAGPTANVEFNSDVMPGNDRIQLAQVRNEKVGKGNKRKEVRAALSQLSDPDAQRPYIGATAEEGAPRAKFISEKARKMTPEQRVEAYGPTNAGIANEVEARYESDRKAKEARLSQTVDPVSARQRQLDAEFAAKGRSSERAAEAAEITELQRLAQRGASQPANFDLGTTINGMPRVIEAAPAGRKLVTPDASEFTGADSDARRPQRRVINVGGEPITVETGNRENVFRSQPIQEASVPASIAPEPGAGTGSQPMPQVDAGAMPQEMRDELNNISSRKPQSQYMSSPDYQETNSRADRRQVIDRINKQNTRRRVGGAAAGAGALAGLAALIGGEREERNQEEMYR